MRAKDMDTAAAELFGVLAEQDVDALLVRGPAIARRLYDEGERGYGDCDVLVADASREPAEVVLHRLGYEPYTSPGLAQHWHRREPRAHVDLHVSLWGVRAPSQVLWDVLAKDLTPLDLEGTIVPVPCPAATAVVVALHASQHGTTVAHPLKDLQRALDRFDAGVWAEAAARARNAEALYAFRQGLTMLPGGAARLAALGLEPAMSRQAALRRRGTNVPSYLFEGLSLGERWAIVRRRVVPPRGEMEAASGHGRLLAAHARRLGRAPFKTARLVGRLARPQSDAAAGAPRPAPLPTGEPSRSRGSG
jgi:hypothetical protein